MSPEAFSQKKSLASKVNHLITVTNNQQKTIDSLRAIVDSSERKKDIFVKKYGDTYDYLSNLQVRNQMISVKVDSLYDDIMTIRYYQDKLITFLSTPKDTAEIICFRYFFNKNDSTSTLCNVTEKFYNDYKTNIHYKFYKTNELVFPNWDDLMAWIRKESWNFK